MYYATDRRSLLSGCPILLWDVEAGVRDLAILPGDDVIAACNILFGSCLQVYSKKSGRKIQHPISDMCKGGISDVFMCDDGATVAAIEKRDDGTGRLHIYTSVNGRWEHQKYTTCKEPQSVACNGDGHFIVGSNNHILYKYNIYGQHIWKKKLSFWPGYISTDHKNRILVSNIDGGCVTVYNRGRCGDVLVPGSHRSEEAEASWFVCG